MNIFLAVTILVSSLSLVIFQSVRNFRFSTRLEPKARYAPYLMLANSLMFASDIFSGGNVHLRIISDLVLAVMPLIVLNSTLWKTESCFRIVKVYLSIELSVSLYYILCRFGLLPAMGDNAVMTMVLLSLLLSVGLYFGALWRRIYDVKELMRSGTVWSYLGLGVDSIYMILLVSFVLMFISVRAFSADAGYVPLHVVMTLLWLEMTALGLRIAFDSMFVILHKHERIIVESMKISSVEVSSSGPKEDQIYKEIYERILLLFEMKKPFLDNALTIHDVVSVVYSNKVYISRAISHYTGRNFRQFVNYYRVMHSMEVFRQRPELKVAELAAMSGFNSVVSYTTAFRLFMNETPSEWCRKEKTKLIKMKK